MKTDNKLIISNSFYLYARLAFVSIISLFVTRIILNNLGIDSFGIYSVVGGIVALVGFVNTVMLSVSNRFIAYEIASGTDQSINKTFNISFNIHIIIAFFTFFIGLILGDWYIKNVINILPEQIYLSLWVFRFSLFASVITFIGVPYNSLLLAKENFVPYIIIEIFAAIFRLVIAYIISIFNNDRLLVYSIMMSVVTVLPTMYYFIYCKKKYSKIVKYKLFKKWLDYKETLSFSIWVGYGALAFIGKIQGATLLINFFFGTVLNAALGIATSVNGIIINFANNLSSAISPQITKSYATNDLKRTEDLVIANSKYNFLLLLIPAFPLFVEIDYILAIWLKSVPPHTGNFIRLMIIDSLIGALNAGIVNAVFASGKIKWYQLVINSISLFSLAIAYILLKNGGRPEMLFYSYIFISIIVLIVRQVILFYLIKFNVNRLLFETYIPSLFVVFSLFPIYFLTKINIHPIFVIFISTIYLFISIYIIGFNKIEKNTLKEYMFFYKNKLFINSK